MGKLKTEWESAEVELNLFSPTSIDFDDFKKTFVQYLTTSIEGSYNSERTKFVQVVREHVHMPEGFQVKDAGTVQALREQVALRAASVLNGQLLEKHLQSLHFGATVHKAAVSYKAIMGEATHSTLISETLIVVPENLLVFVGDLRACLMEASTILDASCDQNTLCEEPDTRRQTESYPQLSVCTFYPVKCVCTFYPVKCVH